MGNWHAISIETFPDLSQAYCVRLERLSIVNCPLKPPYSWPPSCTSQIQFNSDFTAPSHYEHRLCHIATKFWSATVNCESVLVEISRAVAGLARISEHNVGQIQVNWTKTCWAVLNFTNDSLFNWTRIWYPNYWFNRDQRNKSVNWTTANSDIMSLPVSSGS